MEVNYIDYICAFNQIALSYVCENAYQLAIVFSKFCHDIILISKYHPKTYFTLAQLILFLIEQDALLTSSLLQCINKAIQHELYDRVILFFLLQYVII